MDEDEALAAAIAASLKPPSRQTSEDAMKQAIAMSLGRQTSAASAAASEPGDSRIEDITGTLEAHLGRLSADVLGTLKKMLTNIVDNPAVEKYRFIKRGGSHRGACHRAQTPSSPAPPSKQALLDLLERFA